MLVCGCINFVGQRVYVCVCGCVQDERMYVCVCVCIKGERVMCGVRWVYVRVCVYMNVCVKVHYSVKRDLLQCQKRPTIVSKQPTIVSKETYYSVYECLCWDAL